LQRYWLGAVLTLGVLSVPAHGQATLEWKFKPGETFFLETVSTFKQTMQTPGKTFKQDLEQTTVFEINVKDVNPDKSVVLEEKVAGIQFKNAAAGAGGPEEKFGQQLQGATFTLTLGPDGKPAKLEGYADVVKKIAGTDEQAKKAVEAILTEDSLKRTAAEAFSFLPGKPSPPTTPGSRSSPPASARSAASRPSGSSSTTARRRSRARSTTRSPSPPPPSTPRPRRGRPAPSCSRSPRPT